MKQLWEKLQLRLDAMNLRERVLVFSGAALVVVFLLNVILLDPAYRQQKAVSDRLNQDQAEMTRIQQDIQSKARMLGEDPDKLNQEKLNKTQQEMAALRDSLTDLQKNHVPPQKVTALLQDILKRNGRLRLVSLKNLPQVNLNRPEPKKTDVAKADAGKTDAAKTDASKASPSKVEASVSEAGSVYQHPVEIVLRGNYLDMMDYLAALETMRWQLFWSKAKFQIDTYPNGTLTLTVYTLSLDKTWLNL